MTLPRGFAVSRGSLNSTQLPHRGTISNPNASLIRIQPGTGLVTGGSSGTDISLSLSDTAVTPGTYGDATHQPTFIVDQQGRLTNATQISQDTAVTPGSYGDSTHIPVFTVNQQGKLTSATSTTFLPITSANVTRTGTNDSAAAGYLGEYLSANLGFGSATSLTTDTAKTIISKDLTAGDWDVEGVIGFGGDATTLVDYLGASISLVNNTNGSNGFCGRTVQVYTHFAVFNVSSVLQSTGKIRISVASTTTVYLVGVAKFSVSTCTAYGEITARSPR